MTNKRSIFSRLVWWATGLSAALVLALWALTHTTIDQMSGAAVERAVDVDLAGLADIYASGGQAELTQRIADRQVMTEREGNAPHYLLANSDGERIAGDLTVWPALDASFSEAGVIILDNGVQAQARATQLGPDIQLLVAREFGDTTALQQRLMLVFLAGGALLVLAVGMLGRAAAGKLAGRIASVNDAFRRSDGEELAAFGRAGAQDELDELTAHSADAIARMKRLADAHRETSDQMAHEIRTPLMHIDSKLIKLLGERPEPAVAAKLQAAREDIKRLVGMLESLLDIASSKARQGDRHGLKPVDLSDLAARIGELYADSAEDSGHRLICDIAPGIVIDGEEMQLTRLITNLLDNAFKYVPAGGTVTLSLAAGPVLSVADDGPGVPTSHRAMIFERFKRGPGLNSGPGGEAEGAGLGLALARAIAERHGFELALAESDRGAHFEMKRGAT